MAVADPPWQLHETKKNCSMLDISSDSELNEPAVRTTCSATAAVSHMCDIDKGYIDAACGASAAAETMA